MILAFPSTTDFNALNSSYGIDLPLATLDAAQGTARTIIGGQDVESSPALRAGIIGQTAMPITLTNGCLALCGTFSAALLAATEILGITELTQDQLAVLIPPPPMP